VTRADGSFCTVYGKWPFYRLGPIQEPFSVLMSLGNLYVNHHAHWNHREPGRILSVNECAHWYLQSSSHDHPNARRYAAMGGWEGCTMLRLPRVRLGALCILLAALGLVYASAGDRNPTYQHCLRGCGLTYCDPSQPPIAAYPAREGVAAWCLDGREDRWRKELMWRMTRRGDVLVSTHPVSGFVTARLGTGIPVSFPWLGQSTSRDIRLLG
jgi:hypothetical protein